MNQKISRCQKNKFEQIKYKKRLNEDMQIKDIIQKNEAYKGNNLNIPKELKANAQRLCREYNQTMADEGEKRKEILHKLFGKCSDMTFIEPSFRCDYGFNIYTEGLTVINYNCVILDTSPVHIGANAFIAPGVCIACAGHSIDHEQRAKGISTSKPVTIEKDVWIGANSVICGGVTIGEGSVIGAGSVVTKSIPANVVAVGNHCRVLREVREEDRIPMDELAF